jgi:hypothetical protein
MTSITFIHTDRTATLDFTREVAYAICAMTEDGIAFNASKNEAGIRGYARSWAACGYTEIIVVEIVDGIADFTGAAYMRGIA